MAGRQLFSGLALTIVLVAAAPQEARAGDIYLRFAVTGAMSAAGDQTTIKSTYNSQLSSRDSTDFSFGRGVSIDGAIGVALADHVALEVAAGYLYGVPLTVNKASAYTSSGSTTVSLEEDSGRMIRLVPAVVLNATVGSLLVYTRVGAAIGLPRVLVAEEETTNGVTTITEMEASGGLAFGFHAAAGVEFPLTQGLALMLEINHIGMSYKPQKASLVKQTENGVDTLGTLTTFDKEVVFTDSYTHAANEQPSKASPKEASSVRLPFSNVGFALGLQLAF